MALETGILDWKLVAILFFGILSIGYIFLINKTYSARTKQIATIAILLGLFAVYSTDSLCTACNQPCYIYAKNGERCTTTVAGEYESGCEKVSFPCACTASNYRYDECSACKGYIEATGGDYQECLIEQDRRSTSPGEDDSDEEDEYQSALATAEARQASWLANERQICDANRGILYDNEVYYCDGFSTTQEYIAQPVLGYEFPEFDTTASCCTIGSLIEIEGATIEGEIAKNSILTGTTDNINEVLEARDIDLNTRKIDDSSGFNQVCFTTNYLCKNAQLSDEIVSTTIQCDESDLYFCYYGCDFDNAECFGEDEGINRSLTGELENHPKEGMSINPLILIAVIIGIAAILIFLMRGKIR